MRTKVVKFEEGEKQCRICGDPMPELCYTEAKKAFVCSKPECQKAFYGHSRRWRWVDAGKIKCQGPGCNNYAPAGWYYPRRKRFFCSGGCITKYYLRRRKPNLKCALPGCEIPIVKPRKRGYRLRFCSIKHAAEYRSRQVIREKAGRFVKVLDDFINSFVRINYAPRTVGSVRSDLLRFFEFLGKRGIRSLKRVTPRVITEFRTWEVTSHGGKFRHQSGLKYVSVLMDWQIHQGYLKGPNPVIPRIHRTIRERPLPRPYSEEAFETIWRILNKRGDALSRAAVAIGEETGLRISETSKLRLSDVDLKGQRILVRLPTKNSTERWVPFHEKTRRYLEEWLKERDSSCQHDFLFHNTLKKPLTSDRLSLHLRMIFDGYLTKRRPTYDEVFDGFKYHRLRHSLTSSLADHGMDAAVLMSVGGWRSYDGMKAYLKLKRETIENSYRQAMEEAQRQAKEEPSYEVSLEEFALKNAAETVKATS